jgi:hypothetical protein
MSNLDKSQGSSTPSSSIQLRLAQLALDLVSGGFNEIILASVSSDSTGSTLILC